MPAERRPHRDTESIDPTFVLRLLQEVQRADTFRTRHKAIARDELRRGSLGAGDLRMPHSRFVGVFAIQAAAVAIDHLTAWQLLVHGATHPIFSQMTLIRGGMEGAATCRWLVDKAVGREERIARGVAAALEDFNQLRKFEESVGISGTSPDGATSASQWIQELSEERDRANIQAMPYPNMVWLMEHYGRPEVGDSVWLYRLLSAFAHAKQWALSATDQTPREVRRSIEGVAAGRVVASDQIVLYATAAAFDHVDIALDELREYGRGGNLISRVMGP